MTPPVPGQHKDAAETALMSAAEVRKQATDAVAKDYPPWYGDRKEIMEELGAEYDRLRARTANLIVLFETFIYDPKAISEGAIVRAIHEFMTDEDITMPQVDVSASRLAAAEARLAETENAKRLLREDFNTSQDALADALARLADTERQRDSLMHDSWRAYVEAGGDPDGDLRWHCDAFQAGTNLVDVVHELRADYDAGLASAARAEEALREARDLIAAGESDNALHALDAFLIRSAGGVQTKDKEVT